MSGKRIRVTLLYGAGLPIGAPTAMASTASVLGQLESGGGADVTVIASARTRDSDGSVDVHLVTPGQTGVDRMLRAVGAFALKTWLSRSALGRLVNSLGPVDDGRVFARAVRHDRGALSALRQADVAIAVDLSAVKIASHALRKGWVGEAHYDAFSSSARVANPS